MLITVGENKPRRKQTINKKQVYLQPESTYLRFLLLLQFVALLVLIFILEFAAGISGYVLKGATEEYLKGSMEESMKHYNDTATNEATEIWDLVQNKVKFPFEII